MRSRGLPVSVSGVAQTYASFLDILVVDHADVAESSALERTGIRVYCASTVMNSIGDKVALAREVLQALARVNKLHVTPQDKLLGRDKAILQSRDEKLQQARERRKQKRASQAHAPR